MWFGLEMFTHLRNYLEAENLFIRSSCLRYKFLESLNHHQVFAKYKPLICKSKTAQ